VGNGVDCLLLNFTKLNLQKGFGTTVNESGSGTKEGV